MNTEPSRPQIPSPQPSQAAEEVVPESVAPVEPEVTASGDASKVAPDSASETLTESITEPAKVMRIGSMVKQLLEEVRHSPLDEASRERMAEVYERSIVEVAEALSPDLQEELRMLALPFDADTTPSDAELRIAQAQLVGWLEGLFHGIQATLFAQQVAARQQLEQMRQLPPGADPNHPPAAGERPGTYL
jgi:hypothetical protein